MASEVKWIKIVTDIFDDEKIMLIESMPDADTIIVIWFKLLCLAGKTNTLGVLLMNDRIPFNDEMLAHIFRRPLNTVRLALKTFESYGMIEIINDTITIPNWSKHQQMDALEKKREYQKNLMAKRRAEQKQMAEHKKLPAVCDTNSEANCDTNSYANVSFAEEDKEEDIDKEREYTTDSKESVCRTGDVRRVWEAWNTLGLGQISKITSGTNRWKMLKARINQYGVEKVIEAIERIKRSSFLKGQNKRGWIITFDWFVKPNNFPKVLEGQYDDTEGRRAEPREMTRPSFSELAEGEEP